MKKLILLLIVYLSLGTAASAQWQVPLGNAPIGRGPGVQGFAALPPGALYNVMQSNGSSWISAAPPSAPSSSIAVGTTTITGGCTNGYVLYNNGGVVGCTAASTSPFVCDNATDNLAAMNTALTAVVTNGGGVITLPAGICVFSGVISKTLTGVRGLTINGAGKGTTYLKFTGGNDGISLIPGSWGAWPLVTRINLSNFSLGIFAGVTSTYNCIKIDNSTGVAIEGDTGTTTLENLFCDNSGTRAWGNAYRIISSKAITIRDCDFFGNVVVPPTSVGIYITNVGPTEATGINIRGGFTIWAAYGALFQGYLQGLNMTQYNASAVLTGLAWGTTIAEAQCTITNSQFAQHSSAVNQVIALNNCAQSTVTGNLLYMYGSAGIYLAGSYDNSVMGNSVQVQGGAGTGIILSAVSTTNSITANILRGVGAGTGINISDAGSVGNIVFGNVITNFAAATNNASTSLMGVTCGPGATTAGYKAQQGIVGVC